jgi:hypothetical protein
VLSPKEGGTVADSSTTRNTKLDSAQCNDSRCQVHESHEEHIGLQSQFDSLCNCDRSKMDRTYGTTVVKICLFSFEFNGNRIEIRGSRIVAFLLLMSGGTAYLTQIVH